MSSALGKCYELLIVFIGTGIASVQVKVEARFNCLTNEIDNRREFTVIRRPQRCQVSAFPITQKKRRSVAIL